MRKRIVLCFMAFLPLIVNAYDVEIDGIYYFLNKNAKTAEVAAGDVVYSGNVIIPEEFTYEGVNYIVTSIWYQVFMKNSTVTSITIPGSIKTIETWQFEECSNLKSITLGYGVETLSYQAFLGCNSLESIDIPNSVTSLGQQVFSGCTSLKSVTIGNGVTSIGLSAFGGCRSLKSVSLGNSVTKIGSYAFSSCSSLESIFIPNSVTSIGNGCFSGCTQLASVSLSDKLHVIESCCFEGCESLTSIVIPNSVVTISGGAFRNCSSLSSVTIGGGVTEIDYYSFEGCTNLQYIYCYAYDVPNATLYSFCDSYGSDSYIDNRHYYVPIGCKDDYLWGWEWIQPDNIEEIDVPNYQIFPDCQESEIREAALYLYKLSIIEGEDGLLIPNRNVSRAEIAKTSLYGLYMGFSNVPETLPSDCYPCVYSDLQDNTTYYYRAAKALLYLEYGDGITPFDHNRLAFEPEGQIARDHVLKVLMETFNIQPDLVSTENPFPNDANVLQLASTQPRLMGYIRKAAQLGIITTSNDEFRPYAFCTRGEAFIMLYRILAMIDNPAPKEEDYFQPLNTTLKTIALGTGLELGNFQHYEKTSFSMDGVMPLSFSHTYNSYNTTLPTVFYGDKSSTQEDDSYKPMGDGWSHTYHSFVSAVGDLTDGTARAIVHWGGGQIDVYKSDGTNLIPESMGVYDDCELDGRDVIVTTKSQIKYRFSKQENSESAILHLTTITDRNGNTLTINYENGTSNTKRISSVSDGHRSLIFSYLEGTDLLREIRAPENRTISFTYFDNPQTFKKQLQSYTDAEGNTTTYEYVNLTNYAASKLLSRIQLPKGNYIKNEYDANRRLTKTTNGLNGVPTTQTNISVNAEYNNQTASTYSQIEVLRNGQTSSFNYSFDRNNVVTNMTGAEGFSKSSTYDDYSHPELPTYINDNEFEIRNISYDKKGNVTSFSLNNYYGENPTMRMTYDEKNNLTSYTDLNGNTTTYTYDTNGNLTHISSPEGVTADINVNSKGLPTEITNALGVKTKFEYNNYGNLTKTQIPTLNIESAARYDNASRLISMTDALNRTKSYEYNNNDFLTKETDAANHATQYEYDVNDNLKKITNAKNGVTTISYDQSTDWLTSISFGGCTKQYTYNPDGTIKSYIKPDGTTLNFTYDKLGRITNDGFYQYEYDYFKQLLRSITNSNKTRLFDYDNLKRISGSYCSDDYVLYSYDANGNCTEIDFDRIGVIYDYDGQNRLISISCNVYNHYYPCVHYSYRPDNQIEQVQYGYKNVIYVDYSYDEAGRLIGKKTYNEDGTVLANYTLELDAEGNIIKQKAVEPFGRKILPDEEINYTYNNANRIVSAGDINFEFDANGNTTKRGDEAYIWDVSDRLVNAGGMEITYDPTGLIASYGDITYGVDPRGIGNIISDSKSGAQYIYGDGLEARLVNGVASFYITDLRGSVVAIIDEDGNITHRYQYDEFGNVLLKEEADYNPFQYVGKYGVMYLNDHLYYMRARHYDPTIGRFLSEDPIWSTNLYPYAENNPIMGIDPQGELSWSVGDYKGEITHWGGEEQVFMTGPGLAGPGLNPGKFYKLDDKLSGDMGKIMDVLREANNYKYDGNKNHYYTQGNKRIKSPANPLWGTLFRYITKDARKALKDNFTNDKDEHYIYSRDNYWGEYTINNGNNIFNTISSMGVVPYNNP